MILALSIWAVVFLVFVIWAERRARKKQDQLPRTWRPPHDGDVFQDQLDREKRQRTERG